MKVSQQTILSDKFKLFEGGILAILRLLSADLRVRNAALSSSVSAMARIVAIAGSFISIPLVYSSLSKEEFGYWLMINNMTALLAFADLGIGNGLINAVASSHSTNDARIGRILSNALCSLSFFALVFFVLLILVLEFIVAPRMLSPIGDGAVNVKNAFFVFIVLFCITIPLNAVNKVYIGLQKGYMTALASALSVVTSLAFLIISVHFKAGLVWYVFSFFAGNVVVLLVNNVVFFVRNKQFLPAINYINFIEMKMLLKVGVAFLFLQINSAVVVNVDGWIVASTIGIGHFADYAIAYKLIGLVIVIVGLILQPMWPAYRDAIYKNDTGWIAKALRNNLTISIIVAATSGLFFYFFIDYIVEFWIHKNEIAISSTLVLSLVIWSVIEVVYMNLATFLNAAEILWRQVFFGWLFLMLSCTLKYVFIDNMGVSRLPLITAGCELLFVVLPLLFIQKSFLRRKKNDHC